MRAHAQRGCKSDASLTGNCGIHKRWQAERENEVGDARFSNTDRPRLDQQTLFEVSDMRRQGEDALPRVPDESQLITERINKCDGFFCPYFSP